MDTLVGDYIPKLYGDCNKPIIRIPIKQLGINGKQEGFLVAQMVVRSKGGANQKKSKISGWGITV